MALPQLIKEVSQGTYFTSLMARHLANGVPIKSWLGLFNTGYSLTQVAAQFFAELRVGVRDLAAAAFLEHASGLGLTLLAKSQYQLDRVPAQFTKGQMVLTSVAGAPVHVIIPGQLTVGTGTRLFTNTTGGTLNPSGTLTLDFSATQPGAEWNLPVSSPLDLKTSLVGVTVANPAIGLTGTWITQQGAPEETDDRLKLRCVARWGTLGVGGNEDAFIFWALTIPVGYSSSPVGRVRIFANRWNGMFAGGAATVCIAGPVGMLGGGDVAAVQQNFEAALPHLGVELTKKYPIGSKVQVISAVNLAVPVSGVVNVRRRAGVSLTDAAAQVTAAMTAYQAGLDIGQVVYPQKVGARIEDANPAAIRDVVLTAPAAIVYPAIDQYPVLNLAGLTYALVD